MGRLGPSASDRKYRKNIPRLKAQGARQRARDRRNSRDRIQNCQDSACATFTIEGTLLAQTARGRTTKKLGSKERRDNNFCSPRHLTNNPSLETSHAYP